MEVILLERIEKLGQMGDVVKVKPGFARNFLLPKNKALRKTKQNLEHFEKQKAQLEADNITHKKEASEVGTKLDGFSVTIIRAAGESGQLYGSVTSRDIAEAGNRVLGNSAGKSFRENGAEYQRKPIAFSGAPGDDPSTTGMEIVASIVSPSTASDAKYLARPEHRTKM